MTAIGISFGAGLRIGEAVTGEVDGWRGRMLGVLCSSFFLLSSPQPFILVFCSCRNCWYRSLSPVVCDASLGGTFSLLTITSELAVKQERNYSAILPYPDLRAVFDRLNLMIMGFWIGKCIFFPKKNTKT